jgi:hypothetical protein
MASENFFDHEGFAYCFFLFRKTLLIVDSKGRIVAVLVGQPEDPEWVSVIGDAAKVMQGVQQQGVDMDLFSDKCLDHRRGEFLAIPVGVSFGGGQTVGDPRHIFEECSLMNLCYRNREI